MIDTTKPCDKSFYDCESRGWQFGIKQNQTVDDILVVRAKI